MAVISLEFSSSRCNLKLSLVSFFSSLLKPLPKAVRLPLAYIVCIKAKTNHTFFADNAGNRSSVSDSYYLNFKPNSLFVVQDCTCISTAAFNTSNSCIFCSQAVVVKFAALIPILLPAVQDRKFRVWLRCRSVRSPFQTFFVVNLATVEPFVFIVTHRYVVVAIMKLRGGVGFKCSGHLLTCKNFVYHEWRNKEDFLAVA